MDEVPQQVLSMGFERASLANQRRVSPSRVFAKDADATLPFLAFYRHSLWADPHIYPAYVAAISASLLLLHGLWAFKLTQRLRSALTGYKHVEENDALDDGELSGWPRFLARVGGTQIFAYKLSRLVATLALTGLVVYAAAEHAWSKFDLAMSGTLVRIDIPCDDVYPHTDSEIDLLDFTGFLQRRCPAEMCTARVLSSHGGDVCGHRVVRLPRHMASYDDYSPSRR